MPSEGFGVATTAAQYRALGRLDEAQRLLQEGLAEQPDSPELLTELAAVLRAQGDLPNAEAAARAAIAQAPQWTPPMLRLALVLLQAGRTDEAAALAATVVGIEPGNAGGWELLGLAGADKRTPRDRAVARDAVRRAIALDPGRADTRWSAAVIEHAFGDVAAARRAVEEGLALDPVSTRLLALRAEYAPVAAQPALLVDVLTADPGAEEPRQLLDAATTWERRLALTPAIVLPALVGTAAGAGASVAAAVLAVLAVAVGLLVLRRYRRRSAVLPDGYRMVRAAAARGTGAMRVLLVVSAAAMLSGGVASFVSPGASGALLALAVLAGGGAVVAVLPDDQRVLAAARRRTGRVRGGTAWRYGGLRQELTLWTAIGLGFVGIAGVATSGPALLLATGVCMAVLLGEVLNAGVNAPQRYLRALGVRYRALIAAAMMLAVLATGVTTLMGGSAADLDPDPAPTGTIRLPSPTGAPTVRLPSFDVPTIPSFTLTPSPG